MCYRANKVWCPSLKIYLCAPSAFSATSLDLPRTKKFTAKSPRTLRGRSAAEPQPKDDRIGFAACCEDVAVPFRVDALQDLGFALRFEIMAGRSPKSKGALWRKAKPHPHNRRRSRYQKVAQKNKNLRICYAEVAQSKSVFPIYSIGLIT